MSLDADAKKPRCPWCGEELPTVVVNRSIYLPNEHPSPCPAKVRFRDEVAKAILASGIYDGEELWGRVDEVLLSRGNPYE